MPARQDGFGAVGASFLDAGVAVNVVRATFDHEGIQSDRTEFFFDRRAHLAQRGAENTRAQPGRPQGAGKRAEYKATSLAVKGFRSRLHLLADFSPKRSGRTYRARRFRAPRGSSF
jgi:hypothetical protein